MTYKDVTSEVREFLAELAQPRPASGRLARINSNANSKNPAFARNPLVDAARKANPTLVSRAALVAPAPTLFASGDLPPFTASGIDPAVLLQVPWQARHEVAAASTTSHAYQLLGQYAGDEGAVMAAAYQEATAPNWDYRRRVEAWLSQAMTDDDIYTAMGFDAASVERTTTWPVRGGKT